MRFRNRTPEHPVFSNFDVDSSSGQTYQVELRNLRPLVAACTCVDFRVNGLGTCKHVEALLRWLRSDSDALRRAEADGSTRIDLVPDLPTGRLAVERNLNRLPNGVRGFFDVTGLALTEFSEADILSAFADAGRPNLRVSQEVAAWSEQRARAEERLRVRRAYEQSVRAGLAPVQETKLPLLPYQREGMLHLAFTERALLADEMGLGKTVQAIAAAALLHRLGNVSRVLVVAPASLKAEWDEQIRLFTDLPYQIAFGGRAARLETYERAAFFTLANYEQVLRDADAINATLKPDCVIFDEAQRIKNWDTQTAQAVKRLKSRYAFVLTGTPLENRIDEIYSLMSILDPHVLGPLFRFNREFYELNSNGRPEGYKNLLRLRERIAPFLLRRRKADVEKELPDRTDRTVFVPMVPEQRTRYALHEERVARLLGVSRARALTQPESDRLQRELAMMRILCDTPFILDEACRVCPKLDEIGNVLESALSTSDTKVLVFSEWERMLALVRGVCERAGISFAWHTGSVPQSHRRQEILRFKNDPACRVFLSTDTGGLGLNLQQASVVINCDLPWTSARLEQRIARAWRKNQRRSVTVINLVTEDSIEARMLATLAHKRALAEGVLDAAAGLDRLDIGAGRQAFLKRVAEVVNGSAPPAAPDRPSREALRALDPELGFAADLAERLGQRLFACESRQTVQGKTALLIVVEGTCETAENLAERAAADWLVRRGETPQIELVGASAYLALKRLVSRGVLAEPQNAVRVLYAKDCGLARPHMPSDGRPARVAALRERAAQAFQRARENVARLSFDAARTPLEESVLSLAQAYAAQRGLPEPQNVRQAFAGAFDRLWGDTRPALVQLLESDGSPVTVARALSTKFL